MKVIHNESNLSTLLLGVTKMSSGITPPFVASNLALDFINTQFGVGAERKECLDGDSSVVAWLREAGVLTEDLESLPSGLVGLARELRENMRALVNAAKEGQPADPAVVNQVLERGAPIEKLVWDPTASVFRREEHRCNQEAESLLQPVARALVRLLTEEDLELVRQCEASDCVLLFHDQTKSHRRRWCSMASCGNRMKAAAHRARKNAK
ncbi:CGNR zinc finger domain-containing protein [Marinobacter nanhaiticus]|uniref:CGNR zinc finger domain-containing protein n=1 Tax=Marinobacter nanhaiticus TaxID=1305740 RepID=UPI001969D605|nr:ABATE domain-containing protein [Marinobacter nanhaiticus]